MQMRWWWDGNTFSASQRPLMSNVQSYREPVPMSNPQRVYKSALPESNPIAHPKALAGSSWYSGHRLATQALRLYPNPRHLQTLKLTPIFVPGGHPLPFPLNLEAH